MLTRFWRRLAPTFLIASVPVIFAGCAKAPLMYRLQRWGATTVIVPPNQQSANENSGLLVVRLKNARRKIITVNCDIDGLVALRWQGKAVEIQVRSESYVAARSEASQSGGPVSGCI